MFPKALPAVVAAAYVVLMVVGFALGHEDAPQASVQASVQVVEPAGED
jgi:hypothetical protein